jgi:hypothetical protein
MPLAKDRLSWARSGGLLGQAAAGFHFWHLRFADTGPDDRRTPSAKILHLDGTVIFLIWRVGICEGEHHYVCGDRIEKAFYDTPEVVR